MGEGRFELGPPRALGRELHPRDPRPQGGGHTRRTDKGGQNPSLLIAAEAAVFKPFQHPLSKTDVPHLGRRLDERGGDPHQFGRDILTAAGLLPHHHGGHSGLVEARGGLLDPASESVSDGRLPQGQGVFREGSEEGLAARGRLGKPLRRQFQFRAGGHQAGPPWVLLLEAAHLVERGRDLIPVDQTVELIQLADKVAATELDLLAGATRAGGVGVDGHAESCSGTGRDTQPFNVPDPSRRGSLERRLPRPPPWRHTLERKGGGGPPR